MRTYLAIGLLVLIQTTIAQDLLTMPSELQKDFGDADEAIKDLNKKAKEDYEAEKQRQIDEFLAEAQQTLNDHVTHTADHTIGGFTVRAQSKCELTLPEIEHPEDPHEFECLTGGYDGKYLAEAITKITKDNLQNPQKAMGIFYDCELLMSQQLTLTLYDKCFEGEFEQYYKKYFNEFVSQMKDKGFEYDPETMKFVYKTDEIVVDRVTGQTEVRPVSENKQISL